MASYITYQCTVCRKTKDTEKDTIRAVLNVCSITPGCSGRLLIIAEKTQLDAYSPSSKLASSPNERLENIVPIEESKSIMLSTSSFGSLTMAVRYDLESPDNILNVKVSQRKLNDVQYQQYVFRTTSSTTKIPQNESTKDISGKFLRFNSDIITQNRISVIVNGVPRVVGTDPTDIVLTPNTVTFNSAIPSSSTVSVIVYSEQVTTENFLSFERNDILRNTDPTYGAWTNIKRIDCSDKPGNYHLYSCTFLSNLSYNTKIKVEAVLTPSGQIVKSKNSLSDVRFLLASPPYRNSDRYYNFVLSADNLTSYVLSSSSSGFQQLSIDTSLVTEIYPPIEIKNNRLVAPGIYSSDYIIDDNYTNSEGTNLEVIVPVSKKIIGPI